MASIAGVSLSIPRVLANPSSDSPRIISGLKPTCVKMPTIMTSGRMYLMPVRAAPEGLSEKIDASIKSAQESCADDPASGECVAAWDEVEELSAASSHARDKAKDSDPLETYCKDNPETDECRTYE
ncbi:putative calvin cycle protein CP12 [Helianthus annuus]|uniref:Calvin cycle protein CP12 n=1 Tax=Helianthus annuus TaxID=4232 RepID=A0A251UGG9_HELAN|nr:calvin cycle protein CP12-2, chloroplastic [Helianthus annuus]KAF5801044.1 putative calvin cycle protein CP12 [Helianthus annuus]KAJ0565353.1 putative calvin cycle protein CP12 [Helianthus annuus]KAJ0572351.1 putative calvin cycle protein CP12 [Helianthus annuus]KAJ0638586.1 putative calvin cycle protein CP12 [Helianthus annuus]KAJ0736796.1 putative calvin cycle protein CP12 [Helianthus annuus]